MHAIVLYVSYPRHCACVPYVLLIIMYTVHVA